MPNENIDTTMLLPILKQISLFSGLDQNLHRDIIKHIVLMYYPANYVLFNQGDDGDAMYIVKRGQIQIYHPPTEIGLMSKDVALIDENGFLGEMALVSDVPRNASAKTITDCEVFLLSKPDFKKLLESNTSLAEQISNAVIQRLNDNEKK